MTWREWFDATVKDVVSYRPEEAEAMGIAQCAYCRTWRAREDLVRVVYRVARVDLEDDKDRVWWRCAGCGKEWR